MPDSNNIQRDIQKLQERRELVSEKLDRVERQKILETHAEEKIRLEQIIQEVQAERDAIDREIESLTQASYQKTPRLSNKFDLSRLPRTGSALFGRDDELELIDYAWQDEGTNVLVLTAMGGAGKTALMQKWIDDEHWRGADAAYAYSFYSQGSSEDKQASAAEFFDSALAWFGHDGSVIRSEHDKGVRLAELVCRQRTLLLLDGLEPLQYPVDGATKGALKDKGLMALCRQLAAHGNGL
ncbi:MAG: hypothetical protein D3906_01670, partial [Candidatus Electrothrix sp. AUS1_2]|nr:hypothetical protein [Candidatus Electrothrix sp. AUS1_2]